MDSKHWHSLAIEEVLAELKTSPTSGLSQTEAEARLKEFGRNILPEAGAKPPLYFFLGQFRSPLIYILLVAAAVSFALRKIADGIVIFAAVIINAAIGFFHEYRADLTFQKLKKEIRHKAAVIRDGREREIETSEIVPGDILVIRSGDKIGADCRLISAASLHVNEAILTGEPFPVEKQIEEVAEGLALAERKNMVWMGTTVEEGRGLAVAVATGDKTEFGKIVRSAAEAEQEITPLRKDVAHLAAIISRALTLIIGFIFLLGIWRGRDAAEMLLVSIAIAVAAIPEGLPIAVTVVLAMGMDRILRVRGLIRQILATETLGRISVIITDKTGTLTQAKMQVSKIITGRNEIFHEPKATKKELQKELAHLLALKTAIFTSEAFIENIEPELSEWEPRGRPTDRALVIAGIQAGLEPKEIFSIEPRIDYLPFNQLRRFAASLHVLEGKKRRIYLAGAPETLMLASTTWYDNDGSIKPLNDADRAFFFEKFQELLTKGDRVIGVAFKDGVGFEKFPKEDGAAIETAQDLTFLGLIGLHDPIRPDVPAAIKEAREAGIRVVLATGDNLITARSVAAAVGLSPENSDAIEGKDLETLSDEELDRRLPDISVFARVLPHDKMRLTSAWQKKGEVVGMIGDGVNDAPALKKADIGIAVGSGTEVAKEASLLVLLDDSFSIIVRAIEGGRVIIDNIRKVITYLLATGFTEIILIGGSLIGGLPLPLFPVQILWTNLVGEGTQTFSLAFEPKEPDVMRRGPLKRSETVFTKEMFILIFIAGIATDLLLLGLYWFLWEQNHPLAVIRSIIFLSLSMSVIFYVFALKSIRRHFWETSLSSNKYLLVAITANIFLTFLAFAVPGLRQALHLVPLSLREILIPIWIGIADILTIELAKSWFLRTKQ